MAVTRHLQIILDVNARHANAGVAGFNLNLRNLTGTIWRVQYLLQGLSRIGHQFVDVNQMFENMNLSFAGVMHSAGLTRTWSEARVQAKGFVEELRHQAAILPGTLEEYAEIATRAYPALVRAGFKTTGEQARFLGQYGSIAKAMQIGAPQAGRDLFLMLSGASRATTRMWLEFKLYLQDLGISQVMWKSMTAPERAEALLKVFRKFQPMVDDFANTWDTIWGTFTTHLQQIKQIATGAAFSGLKKVFGEINANLEEHKFYYGRMLDSTMRMVALLGSGWGLTKLIGMLIPATTLLGLQLRHPIRALQWAAAGGAGSLLAGAGGLVGGALLGGMVAGGTMGFATGAPGAVATEAQAAMFWDRALGPAFPNALSAMKDFFLNAIPLAINTLIHAVMGTAQALAKILGWLGIGQGSIFDNEAFRGPRNEAAWQAALKQYGVAGLPEIAGYPHTLRTMPGLSGQFGPEGSPMMAAVEAAQATYMKAYIPHKPMSWAEWESEFLAQRWQEEHKSAFSGKLRTPSDRTMNSYDFRHSRFEIRQMFAEGFDPDRIAVAFAENIARVGQMRVASAAAAP